jgi:hypothetical protein
MGVKWIHTVNMETVQYLFTRRQGQSQRIPDIDFFYFTLVISGKFLSNFKLSLTVPAIFCISKGMMIAGPHYYRRFSPATIFFG